MTPSVAHQGLRSSFPALVLKPHDVAGASETARFELAR
jgi:hypothetical protein